MKTTRTPRIGSATEIAAGLHPTTGESLRLDLHIYACEDGGYYIRSTDAVHRNSRLQDAWDLASYLVTLTSLIEANRAAHYEAR